MVPLQQDTTKVNQLDEVLVSAVRVTSKTPVSFSNLDKKEIKESNISTYSDDAQVTVHTTTTTDNTTTAQTKLGKSSQKGFDEAPQTELICLEEAQRTKWVQLAYRKTLAPFSKMSQDKTQIDQCKTNDQIIKDACKKDRDAKFVKMGIWKITKKTTKDGRVCMRTDATDKVNYLIKQMHEPTNMMSFYEEQVALRDKYLNMIVEMRRKEQAQAKKIHPVDSAMIIRICM